jgi:hypothetical protein
MKVVQEQEVKNYIKVEQLEKIRGQQKDLNSLLTNIGLLESQKHGLLHQIADVNRSVEEFKLELQKEYGDININVEDGSYSFLEQKPQEE